MSRLGSSGIAMLTMPTQEDVKPMRTKSAPRVPNASADPSRNSPVSTPLGSKFKPQAFSGNTPPDLVARATIQQAGYVCIALDLQELNFEVSDATEWVATYFEAYGRLSDASEFSEVPPSVAVFGDRLTYRDRQSLTRAGAIAFDRSTGGDGLQNWSAVLERLKANASAPQAFAALPLDVPQPPLGEADRSAANSYPPGVTPAMIEAFFERFNRSADEGS